MINEEELLKEVIKAADYDKLKILKQYLNCNGKAPTLPYIALLYENGNEKEIQPQDYVKNKYKDCKKESQIAEDKFFKFFNKYGKKALR